MVKGEEDVSWGPVLPALLETLRRHHQNLNLFDVSDFSFPRFRRPPRWVVSKYSFGDLSDQVGDLASTKISYSLGFKRTPRHSAIPTSDLKALRRSTESSLATMFADHRPQRHFILGRLLRRALLRRALLMYQSALDFFQQERGSIVFIPNGRFPYQKSIELAAKRVGLEVHYYERGFRPHLGFYTGPHPTQDRVEWQKRAAQLASSDPSPQSLSDAHSWIKERKEPSSSSNEFSAAWTKGGPSREPETNFSVVFFSSSPDEYVQLDGWEGFGWKDQYEAFHAFALEVPGPKCLRVHPNLLNKSFGHALEEIRRIHWLARSISGITVVWPNDPVNTYHLIEAAERVFVHGSTVGLEASADSKCVWNSGGSMYDIYADIRNFEPNARYSSDYFEPWIVNNERSLHIAQVLLDGDTPFAGGASVPIWDSTTVPLHVRILNLLSIGSGAYLLLLVERRLSTLANRVVISVAKFVCSRNKG